MVEERSHKEEKKQSDLTNKLRENPWIVSTVVLCAIVLIMLFFTLKGAGNVVSQKVIGDKAVSFINTQLLQGQGTVTLASISQKYGLYEVVVNYQGNPVPTYFTLDGQNFVEIQGVLPLSGNTTNNQQTQTNTPVTIPIGNSPVLGNANATLTIVLFSDLSCPYCGAASGQTKSMVDYMISRDASWQPPVPGIIKDYIDTGKAKLVFKYYPGHGAGVEAMKVGFCLNDQGLFWKFHDKAFADQSNTNNLSIMKQHAKEVGADMTKLQTCLDSKKYDSKLDEDTALGTSIGLQGTPAFYVNGLEVVPGGAASYPDVKKFIDSVIAAA